MTETDILDEMNFSQDSFSFDRWPVVLLMRAMPRPSGTPKYSRGLSVPHF